MFNYLVYLNSHLSPYFHNTNDLEVIKDGSLALLQQHNINLNHLSSYEQEISAIRNHLKTKPVPCPCKVTEFNYWDIFIHYITSRSPEGSFNLPLNCAIRAGNTMVLDHLFKLGCSTNKLIVYRAIEGGDLEIMDLLNDNGYK